MSPAATSSAEPPVPVARAAVRRGAEALGIAAGYVLCAWLSHWLTEDPAEGAVYWLPAGYVLGMLLTSARRDWALLMAAMVVGDGAFHAFGAAEPWSDWLLVAAGHVLTAGAGAWMIQRGVDPRPRLNDVRELCGVVGFAAVSLVFAVTIGAAVRSAGPNAPGFGVLWGRGFTSELLGVVLLTPLLLVWRPWPWRRGEFRVSVEALAMVAGLSVAIVGVTVFGWLVGPGLRYVVFPFVVWSSIRFGPRGVTVVSLVVALLLGWLLLNGYGAGLSILPAAHERSGQFQFALSLLAFFGLIPAIVIAAHGRTMAELRVQRNFHQAIFDSEPECVKVIGLNGDLLDMNRAGLEMLEVDDVAEARAFGVLNFVEAADRTRFRELMALAVGGRTERRLFEIRGKRGTRRTLESQASALRDASGRVTGVLAVTRDVTVRKRTEKALRIARFTVDKSTLPMLWAARDASIVDANAAACQLLGYTLEELCQRRIGDVDLEFEAARWPRNWTELSEHESLSFSSRQRCKDGRIIEVEVRTHFLRFGDTELSCAFIQDVTAQRQAEELRRKKEEQLRLIFSAVGDGILVQDRDRLVVQCNAAAERLLGLTADQLAGRTAFGSHWRAVRENGEPFASEDHPAAVVLRTGEPVRDMIMGVNQPDGGLAWISINAEPLRDDTGAVVMVVSSFADITASRALQEKVRQAQKMEVVGQLAGGVAHDFNNILTVMTLNLQVIDMAESLPAELRQPMNELRAMTRRASKLTAQLLLFARQSVMKRELFELNDATASLVTMLRRILGEQIRIEVRRAAEALWINGDAGMIDQVVMNLCVNARDAMPLGGALKISTSAVEFRAEPNRPAQRVGRFACLEVRDEGVGMPPEVLSHLFEPFFTTKEVGKGTGLGLATVHGIVEEHRGWIEVASQPGQGSTFGVYLPAAVREPAATEAGPAGPTPPSPVAGGAETILLVEDEAPVRAVASMMLRRIGYRVLEAANAKQALGLWERQGPGIELVITDMVMPGGATGLELAEQLRQHRPQLPIIVMSGYSHEIVERVGLRDAGVLFMAKPFEYGVFAATVRQALSGASARAAPEQGPSAA